MSIYSAATQTLSDTVETALTYDTISHDPAGFFSLGSPGQLTVPAGRAGTYLVLAQVAPVVFPGTATIVLRLYQQGTLVAASAQFAASATLRLQVAKYLTVADGDVIVMKVLITEGVATHDIAGGVGATWLQLAGV
jgi:hypothetical protein